MDRWMEPKSHWMKTFFAVIISFASFGFASGKYPPKKFPFQILYASKVLKDGKQLENFEFLSKKDVITVQEGGKCVLVHSSGKPVELTGPSTYDLRKLLEEQFHNSLDKTRLIEDLNLISEKDTIGYYTTIICVVPPIIIEYPGKSVLSLFPEDTLHVKWKDTRDKNGDKYLIQLKNMFDEEIFSRETSEREAIIPLNNFNERLIILKVSSKADPDTSSEDYGIQIMKQHSNSLAIHHKTVNSWECMVLALEFEENRQFEDADKYYLRAIKNSNPEELSFINKAYQNYQVRNYEWLKREARN